MAHAESREIVPNPVHHRGDAHALERIEPGRLRHVAPAVAVTGGDRLGHGLEVVAGIEPGRDRADRLAQRLAVAEVQGAGEGLGLGAAVVHVILAGDRVAGMREHAGERVAEHRPADMADMQGSGRVGRAELDIDRPALPQRAPAVAFTRGEDGGDLPLPESGHHGQIHEAGRRRLGAGDLAAPRQQACQLLGERQRRTAGGLRQHEGGVGRGLAMRRVARRLDRDPGEIEVGGQRTAPLQLGERAANEFQKLAERVHARSRLRRKRRSCSSSAKRSVMPAI